MSKITGMDLVKNPKIKKAVGAIDKDATAAIKLADKVLKSSTAKLYSTSAFNPYMADRNRLYKAMGDFNLAWSRVANGKSNSSREIIRTYSKYVLALELLEASNTKHNAMMTSGFALIAATLSDVMTRWIKSLPKQCKKLEKQLKQLAKLVGKAQSDVTGARVQRVLNLLFTAIAMCLAPATMGGSLAVAAGGFTAHSLIDAALGPSRGSAIGTLNTVAGEAVGIGEGMATAGQKLAGGLAAIGTLKMDTDEIAQAEAILKAITKRLREVESNWQRTTALALRMGAELNQHQGKYEKALRVYEAAARKFRSQQRKREMLLKEFKQWK